MQRISRLSVIVFCVCLISSNLFAQDPEFSQFYSSPLYLNPALTGTGKCNRIIMNYRDQWPSLERTYITYALSYDMFVPRIRSGVGVLLLGDRAGNSIVLTHGAGLSYAYRLVFNEQFNVQIGFQAAFVEKRVDWLKLVFGDQLDPRWGLQQGRGTGEILGSAPVRFLDFAGGIIGYSERFFGGIAVQHVTQPNESFRRSTFSASLPLKYTIHVGTILYIVKRIENSTFIAPDILFSGQEPFKQLNIGFYWSNSILSAGLRARHTFGNPDALIPFFGYRQDDFKISYSFDITISELSVGRTSGAHEVGLEFLICQKSKPVTTICPRW
ncbi:MAG: PorP/SprF family type IX secretion system membrane protein [Bacteroidetes bacterium]|nr:PorP/SprF family type IX secretion system membrane protein [Bacteroidota bacterium]